MIRAQIRMQMTCVFTSKRTGSTRNYFFTFFSFFIFVHRKVMVFIIETWRNERNDQKWGKWWFRTFIMLRDQLTSFVCMWTRATQTFSFRSVLFTSDQFIMCVGIYALCSKCEDAKWQDRSCARELWQTCHDLWQESRRAERSTFVQNGSLLFTFVRNDQNCSKWSKRSLFASTRFKRLQTTKT